MLKCCKFIALVIGGLSLLGSSLAWAAQGYLYEARGDVTAATGSALPLAVKKDQLLPDNTTVTVGPKSSATLKFEDGTVILLNENTTFQIQKYAYDEKDPSRISALFSMLKGGLRAVTGLISSRNREAFRVATPMATIGIRGTEFLVQLTPKNQIYMQVLVGTVNLSNAGGTGIFSAGQTAFVPTPTARPAPVSAPPRGTFGAMPAAKLPPPVPVKAPVAAKPAAKVAAKPEAKIAAKPAAKVAMSLEQAKAELKAPGDLAKKVADLADKGVSASVIMAAIAEVAGKDAVIAAIPVLISKGAAPAALTTAAIAAGADAAAVTTAAVKAAPAAAAAITTAAVTAAPAAAAAITAAAVTAAPAAAAAITAAAVTAAPAAAAAITAAAVTAAPAAAAAITAAAVTAAPAAAQTIVASAIKAGADPATVTTPAAAGPAPQAPTGSTGTIPGSTPVPGGGGSGTPVSPS